MYSSLLADSGTTGWRLMHSCCSQPPPTPLRNISSAESIASVTSTPTAAGEELNYRAAWSARIRMVLRLRFAFAFFVCTCLSFTLAVGTFTSAFAAFQFNFFYIPRRVQYQSMWRLKRNKEAMPGRRSVNQLTMLFLPASIVLLSLVTNILFHLTVDSLPLSLLAPDERLTDSASVLGRTRRKVIDAMAATCRCSRGLASNRVDRIIFLILEGIPLIVLALSLPRNGWMQLDDLYAGYFFGLVCAVLLILGLVLFAEVVNLVRNRWANGADSRERGRWFLAALFFCIWSAYEAFIENGLRTLDAILGPAGDTRALISLWVEYALTFVMWAATAWQIMAATQCSFQRILRNAFSPVILAVTFLGACQTCLNIATAVENSRDKVEHSVMSVDLFPNWTNKVHGDPRPALPTTWTNEVGFDAYPICDLRWGASRKLSALDLGALASLAYERDCDHRIPEVLNRSFGLPAILEECADFDEMPRHLVVYFPAANGSSGTRVLAIKGTNTPMDVSTDSAIYGMLSVLQILSVSLAPVLDMLPDVLVSAFLFHARPDFLDGLLSSVVHQARYLQAVHPGDSLVLTGHSLGGMFAQVAAARTGLRALVWSAPGSQFLARALQISTQKAKKSVNVIPDKDPVPLLDKQLGVVQYIECRDPDGSPVGAAESMDCHIPRRSVCELWRVCGDEHRRHFDCQDYFDEGWLGREYPEYKGDWECFSEGILDC